MQHTIVPCINGNITLGSDVSLAITSEVVVFATFGQLVMLFNVQSKLNT